MYRPRLSPPIVTLTTDFGLSDHYVGTMKGVVLSYCPDAKLVDITHEIPAFSVYAGAYAIGQAAPYFPPGTVHVVVVDPGVGTARRPLLVEVAEQFFVAPDNGVLSMVLEQNHAGERGLVEVHEITARHLWLETPSFTFHGRDIFAPTAAALARGTASPADVGPLADRIEVLPDLAPQELEPDKWRGRVLSIDHFGNVISNFRADRFPLLKSGHFVFEANGKRISDLRSTFGSAAPGLCFAYMGSSGFMELGINQLSAADYLGLHPGDFIHLQTRSDRNV